MKTPEERKESKVLRELRKENIRLKRQLKEARKEVRLAEVEQIDEPEVVVVDDTPRFQCPKCGGYSTYTFSILDRHLYRCESCGSKGRREA